IDAALGILSFMRPMPPKLIISHKLSMPVIYLLAFRAADDIGIVEQDHRGVKRITRPMLGFKAFDAAQSTLVGIELMHMIKKRQLGSRRGKRGPHCGRTVLLPGRLSPSTDKGNCSFTTSEQNCDKTRKRTSR